MQVLDEQLKNLMERKKVLENEIADEKLTAITSDSSLDSLMIDALEKQYRYYSELTIQEKAKYEKLDYEIKSLESSLASKTSGKSSIDDKISAIEKQIKELEKSGDK